MSFYEPDAIAHDSILTIDNADNYLFGILQSTMMSVWAHAVSGRIGTGIRFSPDLTFNSFPFPEEPTGAKRARVEEAAEMVLKERDKFAEQELGDLYMPLSMPPEIHRSQVSLDKAVDALYGKRSVFQTQAERLETLFGRYERLTTGHTLPTT